MENYHELDIHRMREQDNNTIIMTNERRKKSFISAYENYIQKGGWRNSASIIRHSHLIMTGSTFEERMELIRSMYNLLYLWGVINKMGITEVRADELNGKTENDTQSCIREKISEAMGGALLIEDANELNQEALNTIIQQIDTNNNKLLFILAGNNPLMIDFMKATPVLTRRYMKYVDLDSPNAIRIKTRIKNMKPLIAI